MRNRSIISIAADSLLYKNPLLYGLLGLCTAVFASTTLEKALIMGLCTGICLVLGSLTVSALRSFTDDTFRPITVILTVSGFAAAITLFVRGFFPQSYEGIGVYLPLIAFSGLCYSHGANYAAKNGIVSTLVDAVFTAIGYAAAMVLTALVREVFGRGELFGKEIMGSGIYFLTTPAGGFICLGILAAFVSFLSRKRRDKDDD